MLARQLYPGGDNSPENPYLCDPSSTKRLRKEYDEIRIHPDETDRLRMLLNNCLPDWWVYSSRERATIGPLKDWLGDKIGPQRYGFWSRIDTTARIVFGIIGIVSLLVPLVVLTFIDSTNYRLLATTGFVILFVFVLALLSGVNNQELVGGAAAYAAVLVVFVGTTIGATSGSSSGAPSSNSTGS